MHDVVIFGLRFDSLLSCSLDLFSLSLHVGEKMNGAKVQLKRMGQLLLTVFPSFTNYTSLYQKYYLFLNKKNNDIYACI